MKIFGFTIEREKRSAVKSSDPYLAEWFGLGGFAGAAVNPDTVLSALAVAHRCVAIRSELGASVPLHFYRRTKDGGRERANDHPLYGVLHDMANPNQSAFEVREWAIRCLDLAGNAYLRIERDRAARVTALHPLKTGSVTVERLSSGRLRYAVAESHGGTVTLLQEEVLHIRGPSRDGALGQSPISLARGALGLALAQAETASGLMKNSLRPSGLFSFPDKIAPEARERVRASVQDRFAGPDNSGRFMILDAGAKFERIAFTPEDAEFLASRKLANEDVARIFGVPPTCVGITDRATYSNTEQEGRALVQNALGPLATRIEAAIMRGCLTEAGRRTYYAEHDLSGLLRGDVKSRFEAYRMGREIGLYSANDIARLENMPPVDGGDARYVPANWMKLGETVPEGQA